jgi:hypothetical protein
MDFPKDYPLGMVIRTLKDGLEGIIVDREQPFQGFIRFIVEMRTGETVLMNTDQFLPIEDPVHGILEDWHAEARRRGYNWIVIGWDVSGEWHCVFHQEGEPFNSPSHFVPRYHWPVRGSASPPSP